MHTNCSRTSDVPITDLYEFSIQDDHVASPTTHGHAGNGRNPGSPTGLSGTVAERVGPTCVRGSMVGGTKCSCQCPAIRPRYLVSCDLSAFHGSPIPAPSPQTSWPCGSMMWCGDTRAGLSVLPPYRDRRVFVDAGSRFWARHFRLQIRPNANSPSSWVHTRGLG